MADAIDPLSPESLSAVPEVRRALTLYCSNGASSPADGVSREEFAASESALLLAVRDATLEAERARLLSLTEEQVVEEGLFAALQDYKFIHQFTLLGKTFGFAPTVAQSMVNYLVMDALRAALPLLLGPEIARREQAEKRLEDGAWVGEVLSMVEATLKAHGVETAPMFYNDAIARVFQRAEQAERELGRYEDEYKDEQKRRYAAESARDRLREALEKIAFFDPGMGPDIARAALGRSE